MPRPRRRRGCVTALALIALLAAATAWLGRGYIRQHPEQFPWTRLDLGDPVGPFTAAKLAALTGETAQCRSLLLRAGSKDNTAPARRPAEAACAFTDGVWLVPDDAEDVRFTPRLATSCPVAAALRLWVRESVQPAAKARFGSRVAAIETFGSYSCRRQYSRADAQWSEHATGDAVDIAAFRLADGRRVRVLGDWAGDGPKARFLREARDGACGVFSTVLSPDYNAAHRDHLHLDMAERGKFGWAACR